MAKFVVEITEYAIYEATVTARSAASAREKVIKLFLSADGIWIDPPFSVEVIDRDVTVTKL